MTNEQVALVWFRRKELKGKYRIKENDMTDEQRQEHIRVVNLAIQVLTKQITNTLYTQARLEGSIAFLMTNDDDLIREKRKYLEDDFFVAQQIIEMDQIK